MRKSIKKLISKAKKIKVIAMDIDGVLTAGEIIILKSGDLKIWNVKDRLAFAMLKNLNYPMKIVWVTGRSSEDVRLRAEEVGVGMLFENCDEKKRALVEIEKRFKVKAQEIAYIGDDLIDLPILKRVGLSACPSDAPSDVKIFSDYILDTPGGKGVFREFLEFLLKAKGLWRSALEPYIND